MPETISIARVLETLHPVVTSIGLNIDELRDLLRGLGVTMAQPGAELIAQFRWLAARYPVPRWSLHTREFCVSLVDGDAAAGAGCPPVRIVGGRNALADQRFPTGI